MSDESSSEEIFIKLLNSIEQPYLFSNNECETIETYVEKLIGETRFSQKYTQWTTDEKLLRKKYFFGERYTYGSEREEMEYLYPKSLISSIPRWIYTYIINPLVLSNIIPPNFVNSVTINDYQPRGCIVSHIDPPHIFDRPIISVNIFSESALCFGCKFDFKPIRCSEPLLCLPLPRGIVTTISGYAANEITHCVRPEDTKDRRAVIILRRVLSTAPRLTENEFFDLQDSSLLNNSANFKSTKFPENRYKISKGRVEKQTNRFSVTKSSGLKKVFFADNSRYLTHSYLKKQ